MRPLVSVEDGELPETQGEEGWGFTRFRYKFGAIFNCSRVNLTGKDEACNPHVPRGCELGGGSEKGNLENQPPEPRNPSFLSCSYRGRARAWDLIQAEG